VLGARRPLRDIRSAGAKVHLVRRLRNAECGSTVLYLDGYLGFECWAEEASLLETHLANVLTL
jgi:hypothetical protein